VKVQYAIGWQFNLGVYLAHINAGSLDRVIEGWLWLKPEPAPGAAPAAADIPKPSGPSWQTNLKAQPEGVEYDGNHVCIAVLPSFHKAGRRGSVAFSSGNSMGQVMRAANFSSSGVVVLFAKGRDSEAVRAEVRKLSPHWAWKEVVTWYSHPPGPTTGFLVPKNEQVAMVYCAGKLDVKGMPWSSSRPPSTLTPAVGGFVSATVDLAYPILRCSCDQHVAGGEVCPDLFDFVLREVTNNRDTPALQINHDDTYRVTLLDTIWSSEAVQVMHSDSHMTPC
jgi:hypothetical protein